MSLPSSQFGGELRRFEPNENFVYRPGPGLFEVSSDSIIPRDVTLDIGSGAKFYILTGKTLTINGPFSSPAHKVFYGPGSVVFGGQIRDIYPEWWGAKGDGTTDDSVPFDSALACANASGRGTVKLKAQDYNVPSTDHVVGAGVSLIGDFEGVQFAPRTRIIVGSHKLKILGITGYGLTTPPGIGFGLIDGICIDGQTNTTVNPTFHVQAGYTHIGRVNVVGSDTGPAVWCQGGNGGVNVLSAVTAERISVYGGNPGFKMSYCTGFEIKYLELGAPKSAGLVFDNSDDNHIVLYRNYGNTDGGPGNMTLYGVAAGSYAYANIIDMMAVTTKAGWNTIGVFYDTGGVNNAPKNIIGQLFDDGPNAYAFVLVNNSVFIRHGLTPSQTYFSVFTPGRPAGVGIGNAVQNLAYPFRVLVYQPTGVALGTHVIDAHGVDFALPSDPPVFQLLPGEKVYYATAVPASWKWYADL